MTAREFWSGVWAEATGAGERRRFAAEARTAALNEGAHAIDALDAAGVASVRPQAWLDGYSDGLNAASELVRRMAAPTTTKEQ